MASQTFWRDQCIDDCYFDPMRETAKNLPIMDPKDADSLLEALNHRFEPNVIL